MRLRNLIGEIGAQYDRRLPMSSEAQLLLRRADVEFEQWLPTGYRVEASGGRGRATATPRIAIVDADETTTTRRGLYVAYLFAADMSTVALTLNQGVAEIGEHLGRAGARRFAALQAAAIRAALHPDDIADLDTTIDLRSSAALSADYEQANILARTYNLDDLPDESAMVADLHRFIRLYALALDAREEGRRQGSQEILTPPRRPAVRKPAVVVEAEVDDAYQGNTAEPKVQVDAKFETYETLVERRSSTGTLTRRGLLTAFVALSAAAFVRPSAGTSKPDEQRFGAVDSAPQFTIDVSEHDWKRRGGNLDWVAVRNAGIAGMCARATYGDPDGYHYPSYHFGDFLGAAKAAGLAVRGGYHNLVRGDQASINRQVDWLRRELDAHDANWAMLDVERYDELIASDMWARWDDVRRFDDRWAQVDQRVLVGYIPPWNWDRHLGQPDLRVFRGPLIASNYPLADASDDYRPLYAQCGGDGGLGWTSYGNRVSEGWQYTSRAKVPGTAHICDVNAWRLTGTKLKALLS